MSVGHQVDGVTAEAADLNAVRGNPCGASFDIAPGVANTANVEVLFCDACHDAPSGVLHSDVWLTDSEQGEDVSANKPTSLSVTRGRIVTTYEVKKSLRCGTTPTGTLALQIQDTHKHPYRLAVQCPASGIAKVSKPLTFEDYG